jgi:hypothetical protein
MNLAEERLPRKALTMKTNGLILGIALLVGLMCSQALAQGPGQLANVEREIQRTDMLIERATELARTAGNAQAGELVKRAIDLQAQAKTAFLEGHLEAARILTMAARKHAERAVSLLMRPDERLERVESELERTDEMLFRARERIGPNAPETAHTFMEQANRQQQQAWEMYRGSQLRPALRLTLRVREMLRKLAAQLSQADPARFEAHYRRAEDLVTRALQKGQDAGDPTMIEQAERAREMLRLAQQNFEDGHPVAARRQLEQAHRIAQRIMRAGENRVTAEDFERLAQRYEAQFEQVAGRLADNPDPNASGLMNESQEHYRLARDLAPGGGDDLKRAMAEMRIAARLLQRAQRALEQP